MNKIERPCKTCGHINVHDTGFGASSCRLAKCKCVWFESLSNLEYLEWKYNETLSKRV
jgi:hypothetical protein